MTHISKGTRVAFTREFIRKTHSIAGWAPAARGTVLYLNDGNCKLPDWEMARVAWDDGKSTTVLASNLVCEDRIYLEAT